jgi:predicted HTH domain antitoxin
LKTEELKLTNIYPKLNEKKIKQLLEDYKKSNKVEIPKDLALSTLPEEIERILHKVFITQKLKVKSAIKARFLQFIEYQENYDQLTIIDQNFNFQKILIDLIFEDKRDGKVILTKIVEILDKQSLKEIQRFITLLSSENIKDLGKFEDKIKKIYLVCGQIDRKILNLLESIQTDSNSIQTEFFIEYRDLERPFKDTDRILINDQVYFGFNFGSIEDILSLIKKEMGKGKYIVFCENDQGQREIIWEGIIFPKSLLNY